MITTFGVTYAFYTNTFIGNKNSIAITGDIYMSFTESNEINISNAVPMSEEQAFLETNNVFNFTIKGKNTNTSKDIYYGISIVNGNEIAGKNRIKPENVVINLKEGSNVLVDSLKYASWDNTRIWVDTIARSTNTEITRNYSLRIWIDENTIIGNTEEADYSIEDWNNSYLSMKVKVDGSLETMNRTLGIDASSSYIENNKSYFIASISNYLNPEEAGQILGTPDNMKLNITSSNANTVFSYKDSLGNNVTTMSASLNLEYTFTKKETVEVQVYVLPVNDANSKTDIEVKLTKNDVLQDSIIKTMNIAGNNYCLNNGFNNLSDCILVSEQQSESVAVAKTVISNKGTPNLANTAPSYTYVEAITNNVSNAHSATGYKFYLGTGYTFNSETGKFTLTNFVTDDLSDSYIGYYTCGGTYVALYNNCTTIYKILGTTTVGTTYTITLADKLTYKIASSIRSEVGLYKTTDDLGDTYYYRGDVTNNNIYYGGFYWKIVRINGDNSIRLIYQGTSPTATGFATSINSSNYQYNAKRVDPTYAGYMYGNNFSIQTSAGINYTRIIASTSYYFADDYEFDSGAEKFKLKGNMIQKTVAEMNIGNLYNTYPYTCIATNSTSICEFMIKMTGYNNETSIKAQYITYGSTSYEDNVQNNIDSNIKKQLDTWYTSNILNKTDSKGNQLKDYLEDTIYCNDRSMPNASYSSGYKKDAETRYGSKVRNVDSRTGSILCPNTNDRFTVSTNKGNGDLTYPVGTITGDELVYGGLVYNLINENNYLRTNGNYWTMSPSNFYHEYATTLAMLVNVSGTLNSGDFLTNNYGIRAVINLKSDIKISSGDGSVGNPYVVSLT